MKHTTAMIKRKNVEKDVKTNDKEKFFLNEMLYFPWRSLSVFKEKMEEDARTCNKCGTWYWKGCLKRCDCDKDLQKPK